MKINKSAKIVFLGLFVLLFSKNGSAKEPSSYTYRSEKGAFKIELPEKFTEIKKNGTEGLLVDVGSAKDDLFYQIHFGVQKSNLPAEKTDTFLQKAAALYYEQNSAESLVKPELSPIVGDAKNKDNSKNSNTKVETTEQNLGEKIKLAGVDALKIKLIRMVDGTKMYQYNFFLVHHRTWINLSVFSLGKYPKEEWVHKFTSSLKLL